MGNEEFWTVDLSDDEVPVRDSMPTNASRDIYLCAASHRAEINADDASRDEHGAIAPSVCSNADKRVEEKRSTKPEKLPNGKYRY